MLKLHSYRKIVAYYREISGNKNAKMFLDRKNSTYEACLFETLICLDKKQLPYYNTGLYPTTFFVLKITNEMSSYK